MENLHVHVKKGCLSGIHPGQGTECNERLHQTLNKSFLCGATTIGPEIAIAVITLMFYAFNCRKEGKKHERNSRIIPFVPLPSVESENDGKGKEQKRRTAGFNCSAIRDNIVQLCEVTYEMSHILNWGFEIKLAMFIAVMNTI